jgi:hypothetical protein
MDYRKYVGVRCGGQVLILKFLMHLVTQISGIWLVLLEHSTLKPLF